MTGKDRLDQAKFAQEKDLGIKGWLTGSRQNKATEIKSAITPNRRRVAVLPFNNTSLDPADEYFAEGMTEELIFTLSKIEEAEVISRTSVMQYKKVPKPVREISRELDVGTILEGSVRKAGNRLRITVNLIDAVTDHSISMDSYDRELSDIFAIQSDIARKVAQTLQTRMRGREPSTIEPATNIEAYNTYLRAMHLFYENTESSMQEAVALFEKTLSKDPSFIRAYVGLAYTLCGLAAGYADFTASVGKAEVAARKALELGPDTAEANVAMAHVHIFMDKLEQAIAEAEKAIRINPNLSEAHRSLGWTFASMGKLEAGLSELQKAYRLDPMSFRPGSELTSVLQLTGREQEAVDFLERFRDMYPRNHRVYARWAEFYLLKRDFANAQQMLDIGLRIRPDDIDLLTDQGLLHVLTGRLKKAEDVLRGIEGSEEESSRLQGRLFIYAALGNLDQAFKALLRLAEIHAWPPLVKSLPVFEEMRKDARFSEFCVKVGLPP